MWITGVAKEWSGFNFLLHSCAFKIQRLITAQQLQHKHKANALKTHRIQRVSFVAASLRTCSKALGAIEGSTERVATCEAFAPDHMCWRTDSPKKTAPMVAIA